MNKIEPVVIKETKYIAYFVAILSIAMQAVFLILRKWDITVLLGNLLSYVAVVLNFLMMGITVQNAINKEEKDARQNIRASQSLRTFFLFTVAALGALLPVFNVWATLIPLFFPRIAFMVRPLFNKE